MSVEYVPRTEGAIWITLALAGLGIAIQTPALVVGATIPLWYLAYDAVVGASAVDLRIDRECDDLVTEPGEQVPVALSITNVGEEPIADLRVVDGVPDDLPVVDGSPRGCLALAPGETATLSYSLGARRGTHEFDDPTVRVRNLVGSIVDTRTVAASGTDAVRCTLPVETVPIDEGRSRRTGRGPTSEGGSGVEFHAVREYERGDPLGSIDWRRFARTGELATMEFRSDHVATIGVVVDARPEMYVASADGEPTGAALSAYAAEQLVERLGAGGFRTCLVPLREAVGTVVGPGNDAETVRRIRDELAALRTADPDWSLLYRDRWTIDPPTAATALYRGLPGHAQVLLFSPALDDFPLALARALDAQGYDVTVVSPDVATQNRPEQQLSSVCRRGRLAALRADGVGVVDWQRSRPLETVLGAAVAGGER